MFRYAQIDGSCKCFSISNLAGEVDNPSLIPLTDEDDVELGDVWDGSTWTRPVPPPPSLDEVKANKLAELQAARDNAIYSSFTSTALDGVTPKTYSYDREAADNFRAEATLLSLDSTIATVDWYVIENAAFTSHTRDQFIQVIKDGAAHDRAQKMRYFDREGQVKDAYANGDVAGILAVAW